MSALVYRTRPDTWLATAWSLILRLALVAGVLYFAYRVRIIIVMVFLAVMLALTMAPIVDWLCRQRALRLIPRHSRRSLATAVLFLLMAAAFGELAILVVRPLVLEVRQIVTDWQIHQAHIQHTISRARVHYDTLPPEFRHSVQEWLGKQGQSDLGARAGEQLRQFGLRTLESGMFVVELILVPVLAFSFLTESRPLKRELAALLPRHRLRDGLYILNKTAFILESYAVGQLILALIAGGVVWLLLTLLGIKYALSLAVVAGITRVIPVIGPLLGGIPIVLFTLISAGWAHGLAVLVVFTIMHLAETKIVMPRIIGHRINLHPAVVIIVLLIGAEFFGMWGMFLAAPVAAVIKVLFHHFYVRPGKGLRASTIHTREPV